MATLVKRPDPEGSRSTQSEWDLFLSTADLSVIQEGRSVALHVLLPINQPDALIFVSVVP